MLEMAARGRLEKGLSARFSGWTPIPPRVRRNRATVDRKIRRIGNGQIAASSAAFYAMDRDNRWERVQLLTNYSQGVQNSARQMRLSGLEQAYARGESESSSRLPPFARITHRPSPCAMVMWRYS